MSKFNLKKFAEGIENVKDDEVKGKQLFDNEWISVFETEDGYVYAKDVRGGFVAFLGWRKNDEGEMEYLARFEKVPSRYPDKTMENLPITMVSLSGTVEEGDSAEETAVREVMEESGYEISEDDLVDLGIVCPSKSMYSRVHLYAADLTGKEKKDAKGDGSKYEDEAHCEFVTFDELVYSDDPVLHSLFMRFSKKVIY